MQKRRETFVGQARSPRASWRGSERSRRGRERRDTVASLQVPLSSTPVPRRGSCTIRRRPSARRRCDALERCHRVSGARHRGDLALDLSRGVAVDRILEHADHGLAQLLGREGQRVEHAADVERFAARGVQGLIGADREQHQRDAVGERAEYRARSTVRYDGVAVREESPPAERIARCARGPAAGRTRSDRVRDRR